MRDLIRLGVPAALQMTFEVGVFALATGLAARWTAQDLAAHQVVLNIASLTFMVPLGVGAATAVLVGQSIGKKQVHEAIRMGWKGFALGVGFMSLSCAALLLFSDSILHLFTHDERIVWVGKSILLVAALFQLSDGTQTVGTGALRGLGDTQGAMFCNLVGHWLIGLPIGIYLGFYLGWGLKGLWIGLSLGLTAVAVGVLVQWFRKTKLALLAGENDSKGLHRV
jgi:MATE family multidrug resistance protein